MKIFVLSLLTAVGGYLIGVGGGILLVNLLSSNPHDKSVEAAMTGAFVTGPVAALLSFIVTLTYLLRRKGT
jgi:uncharacterized membrane protein YfcA